MDLMPSTGAVMSFIDSRASSTTLTGKAPPAGVIGVKSFLEDTQQHTGQQPSHFHIDDSAGISPSEILPFHPFCH